MSDLSDYFFADLESRLKSGLSPADAIELVVADCREVFDFNPTKDHSMHYRNGREAKNGDTIIQIGGYGNGAQINAVGILYGATAGNDHCNGQIAPIQSVGTSACLCDCLHVDDVAAMLAEKGLDKRPEGK